jgi:hypothetical protein
MRSLLITSLIILGSYDAFAQSGEPYIYGEMGGGDGTHAMFKMGINAIFDKSNIISLSYYYASHESPNTPSDFAPGILETTPQQFLSVFGICYGRVFFLNNPRVRFIVKGGIASDEVRSPINFAPNPNSPGGSNYSFSVSNQGVTGFVLNPTIEFPLSVGFGFSIGPT